MFKIFVNGELFGKSDDEAYFVSNPSVKLELNKAGNFSCTIYPNHPFYDRLQKMTSYVDVYLKDEKIFSGRLLHTETDTYGQKSCYFEGELSYFIDTVVTPGEFKETIYDHFKRIVDEHNSQVGPEKRFEVGIVDMEKTDVQTFSSTSYRDSQSVLNSDLISTYGGYLWIRDFGGTKYLDYVKSYNRKNEQKMEVGKNVIDITDYVSGEDIFTVLLPIGPTEYESSSRGSEDRTQTSSIMTIESVNDGSKFLENDKLTSLYGRIVKIQNFQNAENPADLLKRAKEWMEDNADGVPDSFTIRAIDLHLLDSDISSIRIGDVVEVVSMIRGIRKDVVCTAIDYDLATPSNTSYTIGSGKQSLSEQYINKTTSLDSSMSDVDFSLGSIDSQIDQNMQDLDDLTFDFDDFESSFEDFQDDLDKTLGDIQSDIFDLDTDLGDLNSSFEDFVDGDFTDLTEDVKKNSSNISKNSSAIDQNSKDINLNKENITVNAKKIEINSDDITTNAKNIKTNAEKIEINATDITTNAKNIKTNAEMIEVNSKAINVNAEAIAVNARDIGVSAEKIEINAKNIKTNAENIRTVADKIEIVTGDLDIEVGRLDDFGEWVSGQLTAHAESISILSTNISLKADKITLDGYVKASEFEAEVASINKLFAGQETATSIVTNSIGINSHLTIFGHQAEWNSRNFGTSLSDAAQRVVQRENISYMGSDGNSHSLSVVTGITNLNSQQTLNTTTYRFLGYGN